MKITISKQFQDLIYPLTKEELTVLEQSILKQGVKDALVLIRDCLEDVKKGY
jgi:hypothetical protein